MSPKQTAAAARKSVLAWIKRNPGTLLLSDTPERGHLSFETYHSVDSAHGIAGSWTEIASRIAGKRPERCGCGGCRPMTEAERRAMFPGAFRNA